MTALRPSTGFKDKTNINPVVNRQTEATAEDFVEAGDIFDDHADKLDQLLGNLHHADFVGYFGSLDLLAATVPTPDPDDFAIIVDSNNIPQKIAKVENGEWKEQVSPAIIQYFPSRISFPDIGMEKTWYIAQDSKAPYLWYNGTYNKINPNPSLSLEVLNSSLFGNFHSLEVEVINEIQGLSADFYIVHELHYEKSYFVAKSEFSETFSGSRIYVAPNRSKYDLGNPITTIGEHLFWEIPYIRDTFSPSPQAFNFWPRPTPASTQHIVIEGSIFEYRPKPGNDGSEFQIGDLALNGWVDDVFADKMRYTGGDPELFSGWEVVEWAVDNW